MFLRTSKKFFLGGMPPASGAHSQYPPLSNYFQLLQNLWTTLLKTMIHHAYALSSTRGFQCKCAKLPSIFSHLDYPMGLIHSAINSFVFQTASANKAERNTDDNSTVRISLPFKD